MIRYRVETRQGKKPYYCILNSLTGKQVAQTFGDFMIANHIVMCLNLYEDMKECNLLSDVLQKLDDYGK